MRAVPGHAFRLYPEPGTSDLFVRVFVFARRRDLIRFWTGCGSTRADARGTAARCQEVAHYYVDAHGAKRKSPLVATVSLWRAHMGIGLVAHEFLHATAAWGRRRALAFADVGADRTGTIPTAAPEERLAMAHGHLVSQFVRRANALGLYGDGARMKRRA